MNKDFIQKSKTKKNSNISSKVGVILLISFAIINIVLLIEPVLNNNSKNTENYSFHCWYQTRCQRFKVSSFP